MPPASDKKIKHEDEHSLNPSYMDLSQEYAYNTLGAMGMPTTGMNDISALAAAASDQLYELERHEAFRRAEYELRHRQIASARKSNGNSPAQTPHERDRYSMSGVPTGNGGQLVYPVSAAQPAMGSHPAVPAGTLADPTYLVPPTCCHEECHKSYRKRLKAAKQTAACPNCLQPAMMGLHGAGHGFGGASGGGGGGGDNSHHSSGSGTPRDRSNANSSDDLAKMAGAGSAMGNAYSLHHHNLSQQLARLQQQHHLAMQKQQQQQMTQPMMYPIGVGVMPQQRMKPFSVGPSAAPTPDSSDDEDGHQDGAIVMNAPPGTEFLPATSPVLNGMRHLSMLQKSMTAPASAVTSPIHSRAPSRAASPVEGHSANSGKHGHGSHSARDAKHRAQPYTVHHHHHHGYNNTMPNSPAFYAQKSSNRMSPPKMHRTLSGGQKQSVEEILNASSIPHPPHGDRILPIPTTAGYASSVPSASFSMSSQPTSAHASPSTSRASSPSAGGFYGHGGLANSLHRAFGMTPANAQVMQQHAQNAQVQQMAQQMSHISPPHRLAPMSGPDRKGSLPSFSRGGSPAFGMEVDGAAV